MKLAVGMRGHHNTEELPALVNFKVRVVGG
jgi:hypothetical protein